MLNKVLLIGRLGAEPEVRYTPGGDPVTTFNLATTRTWKKNGEKQEDTEWHKIVAFKRLAEVCGERLSKGSLVFVEGRLKTRKWQDREGHTRYTTEIIAETIKFLDSKRSLNDVPPSEDEIPF